MRSGKVISGSAVESHENVSDFSFDSLQVRDLQLALKKSRFAAVKRRPVRIGSSIAVISGKGGVGKSNFALNLALTIGGRFKKASVLIDADLGLANADVLLGLDTRLNLDNVFSDGISLREILVPVAERVRLMPGASGLTRMLELEPETRAGLMPEIMSMDEIAEVIVIDAGAGIHAQVREFAMASDTVVIITTPEPTALKDAYGMVKSLYSNYGSAAMNEKEIFLVANMASGEKEASTSAQRLLQVCSHFLNLDIKYLGFLPFDQRVAKSVRKQYPLAKLYPECNFMKRIETMAARLLSELHEGEKRSCDDVAEGPMKKMIEKIFSNRKGVTGKICGEEEK